MGRMVVEFGGKVFNCLPLSLFLQEIVRMIDRMIPSSFLSFCHHFSPLLRLADFVVMLSLRDEKMFFEFLRFNWASYRGTVLCDRQSELY